MQKLITKICWTRWGVNAFTDEVNAHLEEGWSLSALTIEKGLRFVCYALLVDLPMDLPTSDETEEPESAE